MYVNEYKKKYKRLINYSMILFAIFFNLFVFPCVCTRLEKLQRADVQPSERAIIFRCPIELGHPLKPLEYHHRTHYMVSRSLRRNPIVSKSLSLSVRYDAFFPVYRQFSLSEKQTKKIFVL